jgi:glycosyltransferase involved in cell wall biosynthesis
MFAKLMLWLGEKMMVKFGHEVIVVSKTIQNYCYEAYSYNANYIPNGIDVVQNLKASIIEHKFGLAGDDYILLVSRLIPHKGVQYLISAYQKIKTDKKLVIVGDYSFTDTYVAKLKFLADNNPNIIFTGWQSGETLAELFSNAYVYVQPSESEGLPISVLEAAVYGKCVLASDIPANLEIVGQCGLSFANKDIKDLKEKLEALLKNPEMVAKTGKYARKFVLENYNWHDIAENINSLYKNVLNKEANEPNKTFCAVER